MSSIATSADRVSCFYVVCQIICMLDAFIILAFIAACIGIGFNSWEALPPAIQAQVTNVDGLRIVLSAFGGLLGSAPKR